MANVPFVTDILQRIAGRVGAELIIEPDYGYVGLIRFRNGKTAFFRSSVFNINPFASVEVAKDKGYASFFLKQFGFSVPEELTFFSRRLNRYLPSDRRRTVRNALRFAEAAGYPVVVKPNSLSRGASVTKAHDPDELKWAAKRVFRVDKVALVQKFYPTNDFRIVVLDDKIISAYQRIPLAVFGDGETTIGQLLEKRQQEFEKSGRDTVMDLSDPRIRFNLKRMDYSFSSVAPKGARIQLLDNANLSTGGDAVDLTGKIHKSFADLAVEITKKMNLRLCGVDLLTDDITLPCNSYVVLEINGAPGLDNYAAIGQLQQDRVDDMYVEILKAVEQLS